MTSYLKESESTAKAAASYGILVYVYKPESKTALPSDPHAFIKFTDTTVEYTFEEICIETAKHCKIGPSALHLFGLVSVKDCQVWPPLSFKITPPANERVEYVFRIRYKPLVEKLNTIWLRDKEVFMYLYYQMLDDFVSERLSDMYFQKLEQEQQLGHALNALVMYGKLNDIRMEKLRSDYTLYLKFLPKSCKQDFKALTPKLRLQSSLKSWVETEFNDREKEKPEQNCHCFMHDLLAKGTEYMMERYEVDGYNTKVLFIDHKGVYSSSGGKKPEILMWRIDEVMSGHLNGDQGVLISLRYTPPKVFSFQKKEYAESFLAALDGYYRLIVDYYHQLCLTKVNQVSQYISPPSLKKLKERRVHGPVRYEDACSRLKDEEVGAYIVKQDTARFDTHAITAKLQSRPKPCTIPFHSNGNGKIIVELAESKLEFESFEDMLKNYKLTERLRPVENDKSLLLCRPTEIMEEEDPDISTARATKGPRQLTCVMESSFDVIELVKKGMFTLVRKGKFHRGDADLDVALKMIAPGVSYNDVGHLIEALQQGVHRAMQWQNPNILKVHAICLSAPFQALMEFAPHGSLNDYLSMVDETIYLTHLYTAAYYLALALSYLDEVKLPHGNIRCRNIMVLWHNEMELKVKLGDPGLSSLYSLHRICDPVNHERSPWLAPELKDPLMPTIQSDIYAFGTTLWEIFMFGELPHPDDTTQKRVEKLKTYNEENPKTILDLLLQCWEVDPEKRKKTQEIIRDLWSMILAVDPQYGTYYTIADDEEEASGIPDLARLQQYSARSFDSSNTKNPVMKKPILSLNSTKPLDNQHIPRLSPPPTPKESFLVRLPMSSGGGSMMYGSQSHFRFDAPHHHNVSSSTFGSLMSPTSSLHSLHVDTSFGATSTTPLLGMISPEGQGFLPSSGATITPPIHSGMSGDSTMDSQEPLLPPKRRDFQSQNQHRHHNSHNPHLVSPELPSPSTSSETIDTGNTFNSQQPLIKARTDPPSLPRRKTQQHTNPNFRLSDSSQELDDSTRSLARSCDELSARGRPLPTPPMQSHKLEYIIKRKLLNFEEKPKKLGSGNYGSVYRATLLPDRSKVDWEHSQPQQVAVKVLYKQEEKYRKEFEHEIDLMTSLKHENMVKIIGMCLEHKDQPLLLVMEYVDNGSLHRYLRRKRNAPRLKLMDQLTWCLEILEGMLYLWEQKVVHRDLATRNVLVTKDIHMKISDFGLARTLDPERDYYKCRNPRAEIPALWCAPEGLEYRRFTSKGDVWSYGVTVWEIFSLAKRPILCEDFREMLNKLRLDYRLDRPAACPDDFFKEVLLDMCWKYDEERRADMPQVYLKVREYVDSKEQEPSSEEASSACTETTDQTQSLESPDSVPEAAAATAEVTDSQA